MATLYSWVQKAEEENDTTWDVTFIISHKIDAQQELDTCIYAGFASEDEANRWCADLEGMLDGCMIEVINRVEHPLMGKEALQHIHSTHWQIAVLTDIVRRAYPFLPQELQQMFDTASSLIRESGGQVMVEGNISHQADKDTLLLKQEEKENL